MSDQLLLFVDAAPPAVIAPRTTADIDRLFAEWYRHHYPRHVEPHRARAAFERALKHGATFDELCTGGDRYAEHCRNEGRGPRFVKHPATWLNAGCWLDEPDRAPISAATASAARVGDRWRQGQQFR